MLTKQNSLVTLPPVNTRMACFSWVVALCFLLAVKLTTLEFVESCSCAVVPSEIERHVGIHDDYCSSSRSSVNIYSAVVLSATCNCIPDGNDPSSLVNCYHYQLGSSSDIDATILTRGRCDYARYRSYFATSCSSLTTSLVTPGYTLDNPEDEGSLPFLNLTVGGPFDECGPSCPLNESAIEGSLTLDDRDAYQACFYSVRIKETFKGSYCRDEVRVVAGPDTQTSCGDEDRRLQVGTEYIAGIGGRCSPIDEWSERSSYTSEEIQQLRSEMDCGATNLYSSSLTLALAFAITLATMLS